MKQLPNKILQYISKYEQFVYCFHFEGTQDRYLTSHSAEITTNGVHYLPHSGLHLMEAHFTDSAQDIIKLSGIWEDDGLQINDDATGDMVNIGIFFIKTKIFYALSRYICTSMIKDGLRFHLHLEPITIKLNQTAISTYGTCCRANFGDIRCDVDKTLYPDNTTCDKNFVTCCNQFNNAVNFRGEPFIPSIGEK